MSLKSITFIGLWGEVNIVAIECIRKSNIDGVMKKTSAYWLTPIG